MLRNARDWRAAAACRLVDPELFFPISNSGPSLHLATRAKAVCAACEVQSECLAFALRTRQNHGIWGGLTEDERAATVRRRSSSRDELSPVKEA
jgi:WhiB family transcriptional regulator, redox-sensing transcriptional regulator